MIVVCMTLIREKVGQIERNFSHSVFFPNVDYKFVKGTHCSLLISRVYLNEAIVNNYVNFSTTRWNIQELQFVEVFSYKCSVCCGAAVTKCFVEPLVR